MLLRLHYPTPGPVAVSAFFLLLNLFPLGVPFGPLSSVGRARLRHQQSVRSLRQHSANRRGRCKSRFDGSKHTRKDVPFGRTLVGEVSVTLDRRRCTSAIPLQSWCSFASHWPESANSACIIAALTCATRGPPRDDRFPHSRHSPLLHWAELPLRLLACTCPAYLARR